MKLYLLNWLAIVTSASAHLEVTVILLYPVNKAQPPLTECLGGRRSSISRWLWSVELSLSTALRSSQRSTSFSWSPPLSESPFPGQTRGVSVGRSRAACRRSRCRSERVRLRSRSARTAARGTPARPAASDKKDSEGRGGEAPATGNRIRPGLCHWPGVRRVRISGSATRGSTPERARPAVGVSLSLLRPSRPRRPPASEYFISKYRSDLGDPGSRSATLRLGHRSGEGSPGVGKNRSCVHRSLGGGAREWRR